MVVSRLIPLLTITGENGHVEHYTVDLSRRVVRHCTYASTNLLREFVVPLDVESPGWSLSGKFIKVSHVVVFLCRLSAPFVDCDARVLVHVRYILCCRPSLSVVCLSVTLVHPTQPVEIFGNVSTSFGTLAVP